MNCQSFENVVSDLAREQMLEATVHEEALRHRATCESCATRLHEEQRLTNDLRQVSSTMRTLKVSDTVEEYLLSEYRSLNAARVVSRSNARVRYGVFVAVAAVFLLAVSLIVIRGVISSPELPQQELAGGPPTPGPALVVDGTRSTSGPVKAIKSAGIIRRRPKQATFAKAATGKKATTPAGLETIAASNNRPEIATEFLPIGYTAALNVQEGAQLVRVEMPRSAMARFGLPVNMDRYDERVKADVLFSADGMARAIRFVQ
jgi:hypothetical protein